MKFLLGIKGRMTQIFDEKGRVHPGTVVTTGPLTATQVKTVEKDGYKAVQFGFGPTKESRLAKPQAGHLKGLSPVKKLIEVRDAEGKNRGDVIDLSAFAEGDVVTVSATSKSKGFQGVVKRHGFHGDSATHGRKHTERAPGSIGGGARAGGRVAKGKRMGGRMGGERVTVANLTVLQINAAENIMVISGAIPGVPGTIVEIRG